MNRQGQVVKTIKGNTEYAIVNFLHSSQRFNVVNLSNGNFSQLNAGKVVFLEKFVDVKEILKISR